MDSIGPFRIEREIGRGGMGVVYLARDTRLDRQVAIKALPEAFAQDAERLARFQREAQLLASLNHPNIASIFGFEEANGLPFLVLELVDGETLAERLLRGALPPREAIRIGIQIAAALEAAHERGIVHRDLKPGNVMITTAGSVKVLDFGIARQDSGPAGGVDRAETPTESVQLAATAAGTVLGTVAYMSPEQVRGKRVDRRSDVWSFGCVLFECFVGRPAFAGESAPDLTGKILEREPDWSALPAGAPPRVREILRRCLRKEAEERLRDIRDVRLELSDVATGGEKGDAARERSIAVLPFENLSGPDDEFFADGITDEILNVLAHLEGLRVAARTSCFAFKGRREDLRTVGERLDVGSVLEGSVRRSGSRLRITARLVSAADGYQLWSERYDREMTGVFEVQDEIANAIATRLRVSFPSESERGRVRRGTENLEAYEVFLKGRAMQVRRGRFLAKAIPCFESAIALDPHYAEALAWLSDSYRLMGTFGAAPFSEVMPRAKAMAQRALAIDPDLAEAHATLADVEAQYDRDFPRAALSWKRAFAADPRHVRSRCQRAISGLRFGALTADAAVEETRQAVSDDPLSAWVAGMHSWLLGYAGRHDESIAEAERGVEIDADSFFAQWNLMRAHAWAGHHVRAIELAPELLAASGRHQWAMGLLAWVYGKNKQPELACAAYDELEARSRLEFVAPFWLATAAASAALSEAAIRNAERSVTERDPSVVMARVDPLWDGVRADPRFEHLFRGVWG